MHGRRASVGTGDLSVGQESVATMQAKPPQFKSAKDAKSEVIKKNLIGPFHHRYSHSNSNSYLN